MGAWMNKVRNLDVTHVPYRGGAQGVTDLVGGHLDIFYGGVAVGKSAIDGGSVKALAVTGDARSSALPDVPTFKEAGVPEFELASWTVMLAPKGTPAEIVELIRKETLAAIDDPKTHDALAKQGVERSPSQDVRAFLLKERESFGRAVRSSASRWGNDDDPNRRFCCAPLCSAQPSRLRRKVGPRVRSRSSCRPGRARQPT